MTPKQQIIKDTVEAVVAAIRKENSIRWSSESYRRDYEGTVTDCIKSARDALPKLLQEAEQEETAPQSDKGAREVLKELGKYFISHNDVPIEKATIRACDFWAIVGEAAFNQATANSKEPQAPVTDEPVAWGNLEYKVLITDKTEAELYNQNCYSLIPLYTCAALQPATAESAAKQAVTVWKDGSFKIWASLDADYAQNDPDWLCTIPFSVHAAESLPVVPEGWVRDNYEEGGSIGFDEPPDPPTYIDSDFVRGSGRPNGDNWFPVYASAAPTAEPTAEQQNAANAIAICHGIAFVQGKE